jgi:hypothetical protein
MLKLATDADIPGSLVRALCRQENQLDLVRVQDIHQDGTPDTAILEWAAQEARILVIEANHTCLSNKEHA